LRVVFVTHWLRRSVQLWIELERALSTGLNEVAVEGLSLLCLEKVECRPITVRGEIAPEAHPVPLLSFNRLLELVFLDLSGEAKQFAATTLAQVLLRKV